MPKHRPAAELAKSITEPQIAGNPLGQAHMQIDNLHNYNNRQSKQRGGMINSK